MGTSSQSLSRSLKQKQTTNIKTLFLSSYRWAVHYCQDRQIQHSRQINTTFKQTNTIRTFLFSFQWTTNTTFRMFKYDTQMSSKPFFVWAATSTVFFYTVIRRLKTGISNFSLITSLGSQLHCSRIDKCIIPDKQIQHSGQINTTFKQTNTKRNISFLLFTGQTNMTFKIVRYDIQEKPKPFIAWTATSNILYLYSNKQLLTTFLLLPLYF